MNSQHAKQAAMIPTGSLRVPEEYDSKPNAVDEDVLVNSIRLTGIQQPLIVTHLRESQYIVIDGVRRLRIAKSLGLERVPCVIDEIPDDADSAQYRHRIRFILGEHRQDLLPTQRAALIRRLQRTFDMTAKDVAAYLGVTAGTITNWTLIDKLIPDVQKAVDGDRISVHSTRAFAGLTEAGQRTVWESHGADIQEMSGGKFHRFMREEYPPDAHPQMYTSPKAASRALARATQKRKGHSRTRVSRDEKKSLLRNVDAKRMELEDKKAQIAEYQKDIDAAVPVIEQLRDTPDAWNRLPASVRDDFEEFADRFLAG